MIQVTVFYECGGEVRRLDHFRDFGNGPCGQRGKRELSQYLDSVWERAVRFGQFEENPFGGSPTRVWAGSGTLGLRKNHRPLAIMVRERELSGLGKTTLRDSRIIHHPAFGQS